MQGTGIMSSLPVPGGQGLELLGRQAEGKIELKDEFGVGVWLQG